MKVFAGARAFAAAGGAVAMPLAVAIGNFDGVHRGHQALLRAAIARAARRGGSSAVLTFTPHPARLFAPAQAPPLIVSLDRRIELVDDIGIDVAIVEPFTPAFAAIEAEAFVRDVIARDLGARDVVVGYDFSYGRGRAGTVATLRAVGAGLGIEVEVIAAVKVNGLACSSTKVRELVAAGRTTEAAMLLGRPCELQGRVVRGAGRGRELGFPTANVDADGELRPALGIYAARARVLDGARAGEVRTAAVSIGRNPTFATPDTAPSVTVEAYLLDFDGDLYGSRLRIELGPRLRDEQRFDSAAALVAQIEIDVSQVRRLAW